MNQPETKSFVEAAGIATLQADMTHGSPEASELLGQLGNKGGSIPFYAIFPAGDPNKPITLDGLITSPAQIIAKLKAANAARDNIAGDVPAETDTTAPLP